MKNSQRNSNPGDEELPSVSEADINSEPDEISHSLTQEKEEAIDTIKTEVEVNVNKRNKGPKIQIAAEDNGTKASKASENIKQVVEIKTSEPASLDSAKLHGVNSI